MDSITRYQSTMFNILLWILSAYDTHLSNKGSEGLGAIPTCGGRMEHVDPLPQQELCLLVKAWWIVELAGLGDA